ncbi:MULTISPECIES: helix-turn-helix domain-containing protein [Streptomyces]|uniref:helix-turn-helix domain-containing protein n=1 Tax=Streptomyces TaxID=1883 RepID=UPI001671B90D|nr:MULTISPECIES: helix-turn-helix transcriptional regulator [Streptomyces]MBK3527497.1 transcriptional regulator [Streptomyces sp. MBT70]GGR63835.1 transcriptional regulator [Streptomyces eurythermus]
MTVDHGGGTANNTEAELSDSLKTFGAVLKALREEAGLTQEEFAPRVRYSAAYIAKIEQGKRFPPADLPARAGEVLGPVGAKVLTAAARSLTRKALLASWFRQWAGIEEEAITLYAYECRAVPGLLQPEAYIRAIFDRRLPPASEEQIEREVASRLDRQQIVSANQNTAFGFIIEQGVLERRMGGRDVTRQVISHLLEMSTRRNVEIQLMPTVQEDHCGIDGQMYLAETPAHQWIGYTEGQRSSNLISAPKDVSVLLQRYGKLRSQALDCRATVELLEQMRGAL